METKDYIFDGQRFSSPAEFPNLGSLVGVAQNDGGARTYKGLYSDRDKLPHYPGLATGSDALLVDPDDGLHYLFYEKTTDTWIEA